MTKKYLQASQIAAAQRGFQTVFNMVHAGIMDPVVALAMITNSQGRDEQYNWFGDVPGMQRWEDERPHSKLRAESMTVENDDFASGIEVDKNDILDDRLNMVKPKIMTLAGKAALHPGLMLGQLLLNGFDGTVVDWSDGLSWDGEFFFSASHVDKPGGTTYDNKDTAALAHDSYFNARATMRSYRDADGEFAIGIKPRTLVVGPSLERTALEIVKSVNRSVGTTDTTTTIENVMAGTAEVLISDALVGTYDDYWFLCDLDQPMKPLVWQKREPVSFDAADDPKSEAVYMKKILKYGASARYGFGYVDPHMCYGSDGSA